MWVAIGLTILVFVSGVIVCWYLFKSYKQQNLVSIVNVQVPQDDWHRANYTRKLQIPLTIFQNHKRRKVPPNLARSIQTLQSHAPDFNYIFYDDQESRQYIQEHYPAALEAYDTLIPGAYKSDLFRIVRLYCEGGVYFDAPFTPHDPSFSLASWLNPEDTFVSANDRGHGMYNAFMASVPKHPIAKMAIEKIIDNVAHRRYGATSLDITGPGIYHEIFRKLYDQSIKEQTYADKNGQVRLLMHKHDYIVENDVPVFNCRYPMYNFDRVIYWSDSPHYPVLWATKRVFRKDQYQTQPSTLIWSDGLAALASHSGIATARYNKIEANPDASQCLVNRPDDTFPHELDPNFVDQLYKQYKVLYVQNLDRSKLSQERSDRTIAVPIGVDFHTVQERPEWGYTRVIPWSKQEQYLRNLRRNAFPVRLRRKRVLITWSHGSTTSDRHISNGYTSRTNLFAQLKSNDLSQVSLGKRETVWRDMSKTAFVYSPIGCGFDCHRTWEALALGCIVIAQSNPTLKEFLGKYPIVFHDDPASITETDLNRWLDQYSSASLDDLSMSCFLP